METQPTSVINVARSLLLAESDGMTIMKLQLCYLAQAYSLAWTGKKACYRTVLRPQERILQQRVSHSAYKGIYLVYYSDLKYTPKSPVPVSGNKAIIVEQVCKTMRGFSSSSLRNIFQNEAPLQAGLKNKAGGYLIPETMVEEYYKE